MRVKVAKVYTETSLEEKLNEIGYERVLQIIPTSTSILIIYKA